MPLNFSHCLPYLLEYNSYWCIPYWLYNTPRIKRGVKFCTYAPTLMPPLPPPATKWFSNNSYNYITHKRIYKINKDSNVVTEQAKSMKPQLSLPSSQPSSMALLPSLVLLSSAAVSIVPTTDSTVWMFVDNQTRLQLAARLAYTNFLSELQTAQTVRPSSLVLMPSLASLPSLLLFYCTR